MRGLIGKGGYHIEGDVEDVSTWQGAIVGDRKQAVSLSDVTLISQSEEAISSLKMMND